MLSVIVLNAIMLNAVMVNVVAPFSQLGMYYKPLKTYNLQKMDRLRSKLVFFIIVGHFH
jgi:hypothetical protein